MARHVVASARVEFGSGVQEVSAGPSGAMVCVRRGRLAQPLRVEIIDTVNADGESETHDRFNPPAVAGAVEIVAPKGVTEGPAFSRAAPRPHGRPASIPPRRGTATPPTSSIWSSAGAIARGIQALPEIFSTYPKWNDISTGTFLVRAIACIKVATPAMCSADHATSV